MVGRSPPSLTIMAITGTHKRSWSLAAAALLVLLGMLAHVPGALAAAANPGGTASAPAPATGGATSTPTATSRSTSRHGSRAVSLADARCSPTSNCSANPHQVTVRGILVLSGHGIEKGLRVAFPRLRNAAITNNSPLAHVYQSKYGMAVHVPSKAHSGSIRILIGGKRRSNTVGPINVVMYALHPPKPPPAPAVPAPSAANGTAFEGQGMWIWYLSKSSGGNLPTLIAQAHAAGVSTVFVKSSDGASNYWSQFSPELVATCTRTA